MQIFQALNGVDQRLPTFICTPSAFPGFPQLRKIEGLKLDTYLLLCCPVLCRNAFRVALRSSLIFSCKEEIQR